MDETQAFPEELTVAVTHRHLTAGRRHDFRNSPLALAIRETLADMNPLRVNVTEDCVRVYRSHPLAHDARYYITDDAWTLVARHSAGRRVKPREFTLASVYLRRPM